jgi:hypothetical protein
MAPQPSRSAFASTSGGTLSVRLTAGLFPTAYRYDCNLMGAVLSDLLSSAESPGAQGERWRCTIMEDVFGPSGDSALR